MKLKYSIGMYLLLCFAVPYPDFFAVEAGVASWKNLLFVFGHANMLHYIINGFGWIMLWKIITWNRLITAWILSALYITWLPASNPVLGWSAIIYYFLGLCFSYMPRERRWRLALVTVAGLLIPHVAAGIHIAMLISGWLFRKVEVAWQKTE